MGLHFSKEEFASRKSKVLKSMIEQNIDALLMFRQESMYWLTGYDTFGYVFFQTLILDQKGNILLLTRAPDLRQAQNTSNIKDIRIWVDKDGSNPNDDLKQILNELNLKGKKLGIEYEAYGLTGRKIIVDTYGGYARHGGGAFSGKDPTKVDRSAAYAARYVAKSIVKAKLAKKAEVQLSYAIGVAKPISILIETFGTGALAQADLTELIKNNFDLRPAAIIKEFDLRNLPKKMGGEFFRKTASYGHFGRNDLKLPWENVEEKANQLIEAAKVLF